MFDRFPELEQTLARLQLVLFMLGLGSTLHLRDFALIFFRPKSLVAGFLFLVVFSPLLALLVNYTTGVAPGIAVGIILVALMPGGTLSKVFTHLGHGNIPLTISLTLTTTLVAIVTIPVLLRFLAQGAVPDEFTMPTLDVMVEIALFLLAPLTLGMVISRYAPHGRFPFSRWCVKAGWVVVAIVIFFSLGRINPGEYGWRTPLAIIAFCLLSMQLSMVPFHLRRWPRSDRLSVGIESTMRNMNLALLLKAHLFPAGGSLQHIGDGVFFVILFYSAVALFAGLPLALNHRRLWKRDLLRRDFSTPHSTAA